MHQFDSGFLNDLLTPATVLLLKPLLTSFLTFLLVAARIGGLLTAGPVFGQSVIPRHVRVYLAIGLTVLLTPVVSPFVNEAASDESPMAMLESSVELGLAVGTEFAFGFLLGFGVQIVLSGLQLAGQMIDQQMGTAFGATINPDLQSSVTTTGQMLFLAGTVAFLVQEPVGGHLVMLSALFDSFLSLPPGQASFVESAPRLLTELVHQSLVLAVQVAAPLLATMSLVNLTLGFLGRSVPSMNPFAISFYVRLFACLAVLAVCFSGMMAAVMDAVPEAMERIQSALAP